MGSLLPPTTSPFYVDHPELLPLTKNLYVAIDGQPVFNHQTRFHPSAPDEVTIGFNVIGGSAIGPRYPHRVKNATTAEPAPILAHVQPKP
jgi:hypothetical protein